MIHGLRSISMSNLALSDQDWVIDFLSRFVEVCLTQKLITESVLLFVWTIFDKSVIFTCIILNRYLLINPHLNSDCLGQTKREIKNGTGIGSGRSRPNRFGGRGRHQPDWLSVLIRLHPWVSMVSLSQWKKSSVTVENLGKRQCWPVTLPNVHLHNLRTPT